MNNQSDSRPDEHPGTQAQGTLPALDWPRRFRILCEKGRGSFGKVFLCDELFKSTRVEATMLAELEGMTLRDLKGRARALGVGQKILDDADFQQDANQFVMQLVFAKQAAAQMWHKCVDSNGRTYYYNSTTEETRSTAPTQAYEWTADGVEYCCKSLPDDAKKLGNPETGDAVKSVAVDYLKRLKKWDAFKAHGLVVSKAKVSVKLIRDFASEGKRVLREIRILRYLKHENLLRLLDLCPVSGPSFDNVYIVTPAHDYDLRKVICSSTKLADRDHKVIVTQILRGLKYLHSAEIVHRDLKPANILLDMKGHVCIADFGLARGRSSEEEVLTEYVVTRFYRAPELMLTSLHLTGYFQGVDLWSVGCIHVELVTREILFPGQNPVDMLRLICDVIGFSRERDLGWLPEDKREGAEKLNLAEVPRRPLRQCMPHASEQCVCLVRQCLTFDPNHRISASDALVHEYLEEFRDPELESTTRPFPWDFDDFQPTREELRKRVYRECVWHHPEIVKRDCDRGLLTGEWLDFLAA